MELTTREATVQASRQKIGNQTVEMSAGEELKIDAGEEEILKVTCPAGKSWTAFIKLVVNELDD